VDPDLVAIITGAGRVAILAVFIAVIIANPRPRIFIKDYLVRSAIIATATVNIRIEVPAVAVHDAGADVIMPDGVLVDVAYVREDKQIMRVLNVSFIKVFPRVLDGRSRDR